MSEPIHYPGITSCGCPYIKQPDPARHWKDCHYRLNSERDAQQAEPTDTFTAVDMATAAAQGFRDGQAALNYEPRTLNGWFLTLEDGRQKVLIEDKWMLANAAFEAGRATRPAQTEQQPVSWQFYQDGKWWNGGDRIKDHRKNTEAAGIPVRDLYAAPIAQTAPVALEHVSEGADLLQSMIDNIESNGNYSRESTVLFLNQALGCIRAALSAQGAGDASA